MNRTILTRRWMLPLFIGVGLVIAVVLVKLQPEPLHQTGVGYQAPVKVIKLGIYPVRPTIKGYGVVEPDILYEAKSEIAGKIVYVHPQLRDGAVLPKDTVVIRIEPEDYHLAVKKSQADQAISSAKLRELKVQQQNTRDDLKLANEKLSLAGKELKRAETLMEKRLISQSSVDIQRTNVLQLQQEVQNLNSLLKTLPEQIASLEAGLSSSEADVQSARRNLERTTIRLPFTARIAQLSVDENQYVPQGALLFSAQTIDKILINAQFPQQQFRILAKDFRHRQALIQQAFQEGFSGDLFQQLGLTARVRLLDDTTPWWPAKVERISSNLDPATRTLGVIVSVDRPYQQIDPGVKPPLMKGMYTQVELQGEVRDFFLLPRDALHEGELFIADPQQRLKRLAIEPFQLQGEMALYKSGLKAGEQVIVSDLFPAVPGMALKVTIDQPLMQKISAWARQQSVDNTPSQEESSGDHPPADQKQPVTKAPPDTPKPATVTPSNRAE